jgi:MFS family permease
VNTGVRWSHLRRLRPVLATALLAVAAAYGALGWHFTRSAWAFNADPPARHILVAADRSLHEIGWVLVAACTVGAVAAGLALWRRLSDRVRTALLVVGVVAVAVGYVGDRAASHVDTHQPCACDDSVGMTP